MIARRIWALRAGSFGTCATIACICTAPAVLAQEQPQQQAQLIEEVVVTGSRISRAGFDTLQPAVDLDSEFMDIRGFENVADALNEMPAFGQAVDPQGGQFSQSIGQNFVNTFGLGTQRTLTLINGRRTVGQNTPGLGSDADPGLQVDLNIIPTVMVDRIETIFIGGAPIYGTDAIAGTVNIILKDDFEGFTLDAQYGTDERGDLENGRIRGLWGANTADGKGNVTLAAEYNSVRGLDARDNSIAARQFGNCENSAAGRDGSGFVIVDPDDGLPDLVLCEDSTNVWQVPTSGMPLDPAGPGFALGTGDGALRDAAGNPLMFDSNGNLVTWEEGNLGAPRTAFFGNGADGFNNPLIVGLDETNTLVAPLDRWIMMGNGHYEIAENTRVFLEGMYARSESVDTNNQPPWSTNFFAPGAQGAIGININDNPFVSEQLRDTLILNGAFDPNLDEDQTFELTRSNQDIVQGSPNFRDQDVFRFVVGFAGEFDLWDRPWSWDVSYNFGETNATTRQTGINGPRYALALDAVTDPDTGEIVCRAQIDPPESVFDDVFQRPELPDIDNCVPFNPFGIQNLTEEQRAFLVQQDFQSTKIQQTSVEANATGELFNLPAGPVSLAAGVHYREEEGEFDVDRASNIGIDPSAPVENVSGGFDTTEFYGETVIPIVENGIGPGFDVPFLASLQIEAAARVVDNSRSGSDTTWTAGGRLRPDLPGIEDGLTFRGNFTKSIRTPSVQELFLPRSQFFTFANDPCDPDFIDAGSNPDVRRANCQAQVDMLQQQGVLPDDFSLADFTSLIVNRSDRGFTGGNLELQNEEADSWTAGAVFAPPFAPGLTLSADWISISLDNEIASLTATQVLVACFDSTNFPEADACQRFERDDEFQIRNPETGPLNAARRDFRGVVSNLDYQFEPANFISAIPGTFRINTQLLHVSKHEREVAGGDLEILDGELGHEEWQYQLNFHYHVRNLGFLWQTIGFGEFERDRQAADERFGDPTVSSQALHNFTVNYQATDQIRLQAVVNNVFDERDSQSRAATVSGNDLLIRDWIGRRFLFSVNVSL